MSNFTFIEKDKNGGVLRYKEKRCGSYKNIDGNIVVDIRTANGKKAWKEEFESEEDAIDKVFKKMKNSIEEVEDTVKEFAEDFVEEMEERVEKKVEEVKSECSIAYDTWKKSLLDKANKAGNILAIAENGDAKIYKGPATKDRIDKIISIEGIKEVVTKQSIKGA